MAEERSEQVLLKNSPQTMDVLEVDRAGLAAAWIAREKLACVGVNAEGFLTHVGVPFGDG